MHNAKYVRYKITSVTVIVTTTITTTITITMKSTISNIPLKTFVRLPLNFKNEIPWPLPDNVGKHSGPFSSNF